MVTPTACRAQQMLLLGWLLGTKTHRPRGRLRPEDSEEEAFAAAWLINCAAAPSKSWPKVMQQIKQPTAFGRSC